MPETQPSGQDCGISHISQQAAKACLFFELQGRLNRYFLITDKYLSYTWSVNWPSYRIPQSSALSAASSPIDFSNPKCVNETGERYILKKGTDLILTKLHIVIGAKYCRMNLC
jgi:hypothetical protein